MAMTPNEVIKWLIAIKEKYIHGGDEEFDNQRRMALDTATEAIRKLIPKKPLEQRTDGMKYPAVESYHCYVCHHIIKPQEAKYCPSCGHAIDWR